VSICICIGPPGSLYLFSCSVGVQSVLIDMQKALEKGEVPEEELRALESDVTGKVSIIITILRYPFGSISFVFQVLLATWRGTRMEVTQVLHRVCENALRDPAVSEQVLINRAKVRNFLLFPLFCFSLTESDHLILSGPSALRRDLQGHQSGRIGRRETRARDSRGRSGSGAIEGEGAEEEGV